jgi:hypothetical protein
MNTILFKALTEHNFFFSTEVQMCFIISEVISYLMLWKARNRPQHRNWCRKWEILSTKRIPKLQKPTTKNSTKSLVIWSKSKNCCRWTVKKTWEYKTLNSPNEEEGSVFRIRCSRKTFLLIASAFFRLIVEITRIICGLH